MPHHRCLRVGFSLAAAIPWFPVLTAQDGGTETGLLRHEEGASPGYTLFGASGGNTTYLIDLDGEVVHRWNSDSSGGSNYLLEDGSLLRREETGNPNFRSGGAGGRISRYAWDSTLLWHFEISDESRIQHHDVEPLPNGNILALCWEKKSRDQAIAAGRDPARLADDGMWFEFVVELTPQGEDRAETVWEWHLFDHLIQDLGDDLSNHGAISEHPRKVDLNFAANRSADWIHANGLAYNPVLDQIVISARRFSEVWVIDHDTTPEAARGTAGDLLYRWGNPRAYGRGDEEDQRLFLQHDARWIEAGKPGAGNLMAFNNGQNRGRRYSSVDEWVPPTDEQGGYSLDPAAAFAPRAEHWSYSTGDENFYSAIISGAQRLPNGNTLICSGNQSRLFEVTQEGTIVWEYVNGFSRETESGGGGPPPTGIFRATRYPPDYPGLARLGRDLD